MKRTLLLTLTVCGALSAQTAPSPNIVENHNIWNTLKNNLARMMDAMPEEHYAFKPVAEIRSFSELAVHVADVQNRFCAGVAGKPVPPTVADKKTKAELATAMKDSIAVCDAAWDSLTDTNAGEKMGNNPNSRTRLGTLIYNTVHSSEEYGYMAVYLRLKGVVPPSSAGRGPGR